MNTSKSQEKKHALRAPTHFISNQFISNQFISNQFISNQCRLETWKSVQFIIIITHFKFVGGIYDILSNITHFTFNV